MGLKLPGSGAASSDAGGASPNYLNRAPLMVAVWAPNDAATSTTVRSPDYVEGSTVVAGSDTGTFGTGTFGMDIPAGKYVFEIERLAKQNNSTNRITLSLGGSEISTSVRIPSSSEVMVHNTEVITVAEGKINLVNHRCNHLGVTLRVYPTV